MTRASKGERLETRAYEELREAGFRFVQREVSLSSLGSHRVHADIVAWDVDEAGTLVPRVLVEVLARANGPRRRGALHQLAAYNNLLGTREAYLFDDTGWHAVAANFDESIPSECPIPWSNAPPKSWPEQLVSQSVVSQFWNLADQMRGSELSGIAVFERFLSTDSGGLDDTLCAVVSSSSGRRAAAISLIRDALPRLPERRGPTSTPWPLAEAMARLAMPRPGDLVMDPFCGVGTCLWATAALADVSELYGVDLNGHARELASRFAAFGGYQQAEIVAGDSLTATPWRNADIVVANPPFGTRLPSPIAMESGASCAEADLVVVERAARALRPGGRAVIVVPPSVLSREGAAERVRQWVSEQVRVVAVIGLPHGLFGAATRIAVALLVLERSEPTETLVARLGDDWADQLRDSGHFFTDYRRHLLGIRE